MTSTTGTKKELIDFLWEWAENYGEWSKLLVAKLIEQEQALLITDRQLIFDYFLQSIKLNSGLPNLEIVKPKYIPAAKSVNLLKLSEVQGVNKLAEGQNVNFAKNMTVIYGENGTGKTGYCRILKALGFSYEPSQKVLNDVIKTKTAQSAKITYKSGEDTHEHIWDGTNFNQDLASISVFNNSCVQITLADGRNLIVSPIGFHLFNLISAELAALTQMLEDAISKRKAELVWTSGLTENTPQHLFIKNLSSQSSEEKLIEIANWTDELNTTLAQNEVSLKDLNKALLEANVKTFSTYIIELNKFMVKVDLARDTLTDTEIQSFKNITEKIEGLEKSAKTGIKEIAEASGIGFYNTNEFQNFIKSAEAYIKLLEKDGYPENENELCVYCRQELTSKSSIDLLKNYRKLLNDTTQTQIATTKELRVKFLDAVNLLESDLSFSTDLFGIEPESQAMIQPSEIVDYNKNLSEIKKSLSKYEFSKDKNPGFDKVADFLKNKREEVQKKLGSTNTALSDLTNKENQLKAVISELKDRKILADNLASVKQKITYLKVIERLEKNRNKFATASISRKTTEAREQLVKHNFIKIFKEELNHLRKSSIEIDLDFGTSKGNSKVQQKIKTNYHLSEVLSEGEQKAIALAEYLTELQIDNSTAPVIFDDPVNSLDHHIIEDVARRLIALSRTRQVIICTHSVLLFNSILHFSGITTFKDIAFQLYNSKNQYGVTGYITDADELDKLTSEMKAINVILNNPPKDRPEVDVASDGYGHLRSAIELFVEHEIFRGTVKRYQKNVALTSFLKVDGALINKHKDKLNDIFERCCGYIKGHSSPVEVINEPTLIELKSDLEAFVTIRNEFPK